MSIGNKNTLKLINAVEWVKKVSAFLLLLDHAVLNLELAKVTQIKYEEASDTCCMWRGVSGIQLAYYIVADEMHCGRLAEENLASESLEQINLVLILLAVVLFAHKAYKFEGTSDQMSEPISESDESSAVYVVDYVERVGLSGVISIFLRAKSNS